MAGDASGAPHGKVFEVDFLMMNVTEFRPFGGT